MQLFKLAMLKATVKSIIIVIPEGIKLSFLKLMSALPPSMRTRFGYKLANFVSSCSRLPLNVSTSMGISRNYKYEVSATFAPNIAWGKPQFDNQEWHSMLLVGYLSKECNCFIDIGSYIGSYVFYVRAVLDASKPIFYFEPVPEYFEQIQQNIAQNQLVNVVGFCKAVSDSTGQTTFYRNNTHSTCGSLTERYADKHEVQKTNVETISFDDFVNSFGLSDICLKIDIEGAEHLFLKGASSSLDRIRCLVIEVLDAKSDFLTDMKACGFEIYHITVKGLVYCSQGTDEYIPGQWNWLMCRLNPKQLQDLIRPTGIQVTEQSAAQVNR